MSKTVKAARTRLRRATARLITAEKADSWKGGGDPDDIPSIERELLLARDNWVRAVAHFEKMVRADALTSVHLTLEGNA